MQIVAYLLIAACQSAIGTRHLVYIAIAGEEVECVAGQLPCQQTVGHICGVKHD